MPVPGLVAPCRRSNARVCAGRGRAHGHNSLRIIYNTLRVSICILLRNRLFHPGNAFADQFQFDLFLPVFWRHSVNWRDLFTGKRLSGRTWSLPCALALSAPHETGGFRKSLPALAALSALTILGYAFILSAPQFEALRAHSPIAFLKNFGNCALWPFKDNWLFLLGLWTPFLLLIWKHFRIKKAFGHFERFIMAMGFWVLLQAAAIAYARGMPTSRYTDLLAFGPLVNISALLLLLEDSRAGVLSRWWGLIGVPVIVLCVAFSTLHTNRKLEGRHDYFAIFEANTAGYILTGDVSFLLNKPIPYPQVEPLEIHLSDPVVQAMLPVSLRKPLDLGRGEGSGFGSKSIPPDIAMPYRMVTGSWTSEGAKGPAQFLSQPVASRYSWWLRYCGRRDRRLPGSRSLLGGPEVRVPFKKADGRWHKVTVRAPEGQFRVRATDGSRTGWLAFSWPRELAYGSYFAGRVSSKANIMEWLGLIILLAGIYRTATDASG